MRTVQLPSRRITNLTALLVADNRAYRTRLHLGITALGGVAAMVAVSNASLSPFFDLSFATVPATSSVLPVFTSHNDAVRKIAARRLGCG